MAQGKVSVDEKGEVIKMFGTSQDISSMKKAEANLEKNNKELQRKNKELEQFAYVASHDLQEPLRTTTSFVHMFQKKYQGKLDSNADKYLNYIVNASERMRVLITDLLDYSHIGKEKELEKADSDELFKEVLDDLALIISETGAEIKASLLPEISCYPKEIKQLFQNLVMNAIKFRKKGTVPQLVISVVKEKGFWQFSFKDNGIGIEEEHKDRIFIIFQRLHTRSEYQGSGIGLSHCKKIVELHNGRIWVQSIPGEGSTFHFTVAENNLTLNQTISYETKTELHPFN
jgi:light-regulated signal transduction histidine kinase (bacteriophytochrome)